MKRLLLNFCVASTLFAAGLLYADDGDKLTGKWSVKKANDQGQSFTQTIEIKKDKFVFEVRSADNELAIHAEGDLQLSKSGAFKTARFFHVRGGASATDLQDVDDEYDCIYALEGDTWMLASNFDKTRKEKASVHAYHRMKSTSQNSTLVIDAIEMADTPQTAIWYLCFEATVDGVKKRHFLPDKGYEKNQVNVPMTLEFPKAHAGQKCSFKLQLDDIEEDTCGDEPDQRSTGEFTVNERGSQTYKPEGNLQYTIRWHLK